MHVRCPHCHQPLELADNAGLEPMDCPSCGIAWEPAAEATAIFEYQALPELAAAPRDAPTLAPAHCQHRLAAETIGRSADAAVISKFAEGRAFGEYELQAEIARGGMGIVFKARQTRLNRIVAVKMILAGELADREDVRRFLSEAEAAAGLDHPGIVPVYESGEIGGQHFFSMGFVDGESLATRLADGPLPPRRAAALLAELADAVDYAHERGVIHRDLKPGNILLDRDGHPRVTDFGLAKRVTGDSGLTRTGQTLGTPSYMPPEQASGKLDAIGRAADVYALGAVLYAALTGRPPFQAATPLDTMLQVLDQDPVAPRQLNAGVPRDLETIALKCLEKEPHKRYATAQELAGELRRFLRGEPIHARPVGRVERGWRWCKRKPVVAGLAAGVAAALVAGTVVSSYFAIEANHRAIVESSAKQEALALKTIAEKNAKQAKTEARRADQNAAEAKANARIAKANAEREARARVAAERQLRLATAERLAAISYTEREESPDVSLLLAVESGRATRPDDQRLQPNCHQALLDALAAIGGRSLVGHRAEINGVAISPDGRWLATASEDHRVRLWRWQWDDLVSLAAQTGRNFTREEWALYLPNVPCRKTFPELPASYEDEVADVVQIKPKAPADLTRVAAVKSGEPADLATPPVAIEGRIRNSSFEATLDDWSINIYGAKSEVVLDREVKHGGDSSLRIASPALSDTAVGQELQLKPGQNYRLTGWVKTSGLDPKGSPVFGTFQVQNAGGRGTIATGANHQGDNDWTHVSLFFQSPPSGKVRVAVFFVGFGKGTGTAWFDDLKLDAIDLAKVPLKITRQFLLPDTISPYQYGQFIEYLCDLVPSMWAEKLNDGSFEGPSTYKVAFIKEDDNREKPWYSSGDTNRAEYASDPQNPVSGQVSRRIVVRDGPPSSVGISSVGISQDGVAVKAGRVCTFSCFLRQTGMEGPVSVRLHKEGRTLASGDLRATDQWQKATVELRPTETTSAATLSIEMHGPGTLWIDNASLMPDDSIAGWRADVVEAVRALKPGVIRFGGSALDDSNLGEFEWRDTIGPVEHRRPFRAWGGWQPAGAGLEEIVQFCRLVDAEPLICLRVSKKGPPDAADQVQYFNGAADTPQGRLRAENGQAEPYGIKFWQVGNERAGGEYEARLPEFCRAMKAVDPTIAILSSYPTAGVLAGSGQWLDYVAPHHYSIANLSGAAADLQAIRQLIDQHAAGRKIKLAVTEWNTTAGDWGPRRAMLWTLDNALACARYHNLLHRHCDLVEIANRSNLINSFCSGILQTDNHRLYKTPTYYAQQLYATRAGNRPLAIESWGPVNLWPDVSATLSADGKTVVLFAVNPSPRDVTRPLDLRAFGDAPRTISAWTLADTKKAGEPDVTNSFVDPERISPVESRFEASGGTFDYRFPKWSLTVLEWPVGD